MNLRMIVALLVFAAVVWSIPYVVELPWLTNDPSPAQQEAQQRREVLERARELAEHLAPSPTPDGRCGECHWEEDAQLDREYEIEREAYDEGYNDGRRNRYDGTTYDYSYDDCGYGYDGYDYEQPC